MNIYKVVDQSVNDVVYWWFITIILKLMIHTKICPTPVSGNLLRIETAVQMVRREDDYTRYQVLKSVFYKLKR